MTMRFFFAAVAAMLLAAAPASALAPGVALGGAQFTIGISGFVPVICRANVSAGVVTPAAGTTSLGALDEFCNSPNGYVVVAQSSPSLGGATLLVDSRPVPLAADGTTVVSESSTPAIASHTLALQTADGRSQGSLSFRIEPR